MRTDHVKATNALDSTSNREEEKSETGGEGTWGGVGGGEPCRPARDGWVTVRSVTQKYCGGGGIKIRLLNGCCTCMASPTDS